MLYIRRLFQKQQFENIDFFSYKYSSTYLTKVLRAIKIGIEDGTPLLRSRLNPLLDKVEEDMKRLVDPNELSQPKYKAYESNERSTSSFTFRKSNTHHQRYNSVGITKRALNKNRPQ